MKKWQTGLLIAGAGLAGVVALRMAQPPAALKPAPAAAPVSEVPGPVAASAPPVRWKAAPPPEDVASAPPAVYTEPPAVPARPVKRTPFPQPAPVAKTPAPKPVPYETPPKPARHVTLEPGVNIVVRFEGANGFLAQPVVAEGLEVAEQGARVTVLAEAGNKLRLTSFQSADGQRVEVSTEPVPSGGAVIRFRLASRTTITERRL